MDDIKIIQLAPESWEQYKNLRLEAVQEDPLAFGLTYEEYSDYPDEFWKNHLEKSVKGQDSWIFFAQVKDELIGMLAADRVNKKRMSHLSHIHSMSVKQGYRGKGVASMLMEALLNKLTQQEDLLIAQMGVASSQNAAVQLYKKFGFEIVGTRKKVFRYGNDFYDEILMEKELR